MIYTEYAIYDFDNTEDEIKLRVESAIRLGINCISVPFALTKFCKNITKNTNTIVSNAIDYPLGILDTKTRNNAVSNAIDNGAEKIEIMIQNNYLSGKKYDKIRQDIKTNHEICQAKNIPIYYYLEYRVFTHHSLIKACNLLLETPIDTVYVSSGHMLDSVEDNMIATMLLQQKTNIKSIFSTDIWTKQQAQLLLKNNIDKFRFKSINSLDTLLSVWHSSSNNKIF